MKHFYKSNGCKDILLRKPTQLLVWLSFALTAFSAFPAPTPNSFAKGQKDKQPMKSVTNYLESNYNQVGNTRLYLRQTYNFDFWGQFGEFYYGSTYSNGGYQMALKVNDNSAENIDSSNPTELYGIKVATLFEPQGEMVRVSYVLNNTTQEDIVISLGTYADVQIGDNDCAPISRRIDYDNNTYGLTMKDGSGAELCILFGSGLAGVTPVSDFWFGNYGSNSYPYNIVGEYEETGNFMYENGNYDSAMGWCWKDKTIRSNDSATYSFLIGIGDVNLQPGVSYSVTPDDPEGWNDIYAVHRINIDGIYTSPAGVDGRIEYAVEYPDLWQPLTDMIPSDTEFSQQIDLYFDPEKKIHTVYLRIVDNVGNTTMLDPIEYLDVNHVEYDPFIDFTYNGEEHFQNVITTEIDNNKYIVSNYENNINAGTAYFTIEGVYPETIGKKYCEFQINPAPLEGTIILHQTEFDFVAGDIRPDYTLDGPVANLNENSYWVNGDYDVKYTDNHYAGTALMTIEGVNNYCGTLSASFTINKTHCQDDWIEFRIPEEDITYDGTQHAAWVRDIDGVGEMILTYVCDDSHSEEAPSNAGDYEVFIEFTEGPGFYAIPRRSLGCFSIYNLNDDDWNKLLALNEELSKDNNTTDLWELTNDKTSAAKLNHNHITIEKGNITQLWLTKRGLKGELPLTAFRFKNVREMSLANNDFTGDIDRLAFIKEEDPEALSNLKSLSIYDNKLTGNAGVLSQFPNIEWIDITQNFISEVVPMLNPTTGFAYYQQTLDLTLNLDLRDFNLDILTNQIPTIVLYDHEAQSYSSENLEVYLFDNSWNISISNLKEEALCLSDNDLVYHGKSGDTLGAILPNECYAKVQLWFNQGDVNFSASVDLLDLQSIINDILYNRYWQYLNRWTAFNFTAANLYEDDIINVQDAVCLVNMLLESDPAPAQVSPKSPSTQEENDVASVFVDGTALFISSEKDVAAFDVIVESENVSLEKIPGMSLTKKSANGKTHIIGYSLAGFTINMGTVKIADTDANAVSFAMLSDTNAVEIPTTLNTRPSGISVIKGDQNLTINSEGISILLPDAIVASWQILSVSGMTLAQGVDNITHGKLYIPFNASPGSVYILSISYDGKHIYKKFNQK
ncbi:MAG: leucine-rich repeat domain-containing protein [Bacteroides sp.]|nr:leucine-rich repeat domain-containing protein [Bacteroides sp.]